MNNPILLLRKNSEEKKRKLQLIRTEIDLEKARAKFSELSKILNNELADVQKIEGTVLQHFFTISPK